MPIEIRNIEHRDAGAVVELMREFAAYEKLEDHLEVNEERLAAAMFGTDAFVQGLIAHDGEEAVGYAIFYPNFLTFRGQRGFFLEDLFVSQRHRYSGLGKALLIQIAKIARERGFERIDFLVLDWNETAIRFYKNLGAVTEEAESHFKFTDKAFRDLAAA
jgi:GNAT superfamily N-acetyltransferase